LPTVPAVVIAFWRMALASVLLWIYSLIKPQGRFPHEHLLTVTVAGIFLGLHFACFFSAVKLTSIANATILGTIAPVFTVLIETVFLKRKLFKQVLFGVFFALAGALVINSGGFSILENSALGNALALLGSFFIALVFILAEKIRQNTPTVVYCRTLYFSASCTLFVLSSVLGGAVFSFTQTDFGLFFALAAIPTIMGHSVLSYVVRFISPSSVTAVPLGEPIIASFFAWVLFGEQIHTLTCFGGILVFLGLYLTIAGSARNQHHHKTL
jgi:drug/metabolite transporter (DMT)-like permease|tara:strand:- start:4330 stop:5136 length:807 start_codon:yes stop_codon:yes gene_type:complete